MNLFCLLRPILALGLLAGLLAGCTSGPPQPAWIPETSQFLLDYRTMALRGKAELAAKRLQEAENLLRSAGDIPGFWRLKAHKDAVRIATGQPLPALRDQWIHWVPAETKALRQFYRTPLAIDPDNLPETYQSFARMLHKNDPRKIFLSLESIKDPFRRLVCSRIYLNNADLPYADAYKLAVDTAAHWGWTKPLVQLLKEYARFQDNQGQFDKAKRLRQRIEFIRRIP